jgi:hypothetical protein
VTVFDCADYAPRANLAAVFDLSFRGMLGAHAID